MRPVPSAEERRLATLHGRSWAWAVVCARFDREEAAAILQETYRRLLFGGAGADGGTFLASLLREVRRVARRRRRAAFLETAGGLLCHGILPATAVREPDAGLVWDTRARAVAGLLLLLPEREREVVALVLGEELSLEEAARVLGIGEGHAARLLARGAARLEEGLGAPSAPAGDAGERHGGRR